MTLRSTASVILLGLFLSACSQDTQTAQTIEPEPENRDIVEAAFTSADQNQDGSLDSSETKLMADNMFLSMDYDDSAAISANEFDDWDFGLIYTSANAGQSSEYGAAKRILFALRDLNSDDVISLAEYRQSIEFDFSRADGDSDGLMTKGEYGKGFMPSLVFRAALEKPAEE